MARRSVDRWSQNPAQHRVIHCPDMSCGAPMKVPSPARRTPVLVTCEGISERHTWAHSALSPGRGGVTEGVPT